MHAHGREDGACPLTVMKRRTAKSRGSTERNDLQQERNRCIACCMVQIVDVLSLRDQAKPNGLANRRHRPRYRAAGLTGTKTLRCCGCFGAAVLMSLELRPRFSRGARRSELRYPLRTYARSKSMGMLTSISVQSIQCYTAQPVDHWYQTKSLLHANRMGFL